MIDNTVDTTTGTIHLKATFDESRTAFCGRASSSTSVLTLDTLAGRHRGSGRGGAARPAGAVRLRGEGGQHRGIARRSPPGRAFGKKMVIEKGIAPGDTVVTDGQLRLFPGAQVQTGGPGEGRDGASHEPFAHLHRAPDHDGAGLLRHSAVRHRRLPRAAGGGAAERGLPDHPGERRACPAPVRRPWRRRWPRRSSASSPPSPACSR